MINRSLKNIERLEMDLCHDFWLDISEMVDALEEIDYYVEDYNDEYVVVCDGRDEDEACYILYLGHANRTIWVESIREVQ